MSKTRQGKRIGIIGCAVGGFALLALAIVVLIVVAAVPDPLALLFSLFAASIPAFVYATLVLRLDRYEVEPLRNILACFAWGAVGAILLSIIGSVLFQAYVEGAVGVNAAPIVTVVLGSPLIEETFKGIAVLAVLFFARDEFDSVLDGLVYGALVGVGFAMTENVLYFGQAFLAGGLNQFGIIVLGRAVLGGFGHPSYTAVTGAAIGWARERYGQGFLRFLVPVLGWAGAVAIHTAWNGGLILTAALLGESAGLLEVIAIQAAIVIVPAVLVLYAIARASARHELAILTDELPQEVASGILTQLEYQTIIDATMRQRALARAQARGGRALRGRQNDFFHTAAELAYRSHHRRRGDARRPSQQASDESDRQRLLALRDELAAAGLSATDA